ncbi:DUF6777 domain-containing protein [Streptomyces griseocarneus]|uniref:DUF6777 domain-containing protein n=1 Tax=Streptomyces griseocarneus TaxID=51201 RepID=UPI00167C6A58|nr:DUF6777 domain-containing protein [Streptomyces griseocarneus]MBZ6474185.1 hypothetical protein [Streptomyces griseocarneus]GHG52470.1 hypothetical protein GCM10018779_13770 [Streptomyces griseocarneus]
MQRIRVVALLVASGLLAGVGVVGCGKGDEAKAVKDIALEPTGVIAANAFLKSPGVDVQGVRSVPQAGDTTRGDARGAFGGTRKASQCDKAQLLTELARDEVKARAWAEARGIVYERLREHVDSLTSVVLLRDTLVRNHNYQGDGKTVEYLSVLQAGIAVLVDEYGQPAVKCNCGNPLKEPGNIDRKDSTYKGPRWEGFVNVRVTVVVPRDKDDGPMRKITLVDPKQPDKGFERPAGTDGTKDSGPVSVPTVPTTPTATPSTAPSGTASTTPDPSGSSSGSASEPPVSTPSGTPSSGGPGTSRPPLGTPSTPRRTATPPLPPPHTPTGGGASTAPRTPGVRPPVTQPVDKTPAQPVRTTAAAPVERTAAPPVRTTAAAPVERSAPPPATAPRERTVAPPAEPPPAKTAAPPAGASGAGHS